jgi:hypothetical protein
LEEEEIYDPESPDSPGPSDPDATTPTAPAAEETKRKRESGGARSAMASRSAGWIVAAFLAGVVVTLSATVIAWPSSTTLVQSAANTSGLRVIRGQAVVGLPSLKAQRVLAGCAPGNLGSVVGVPGRVSVTIGKPGQRSVTLKGAPPVGVRQWVVVRGSGGQTTVRLIGPRVKLRQVKLRQVKLGQVKPGQVPTFVQVPAVVRGKQVTLPGGRHVVIVRPGQATFSIGGAPGGPGQVVIGPGASVNYVGPGCQAQAVYQP